MMERIREKFIADTLQSLYAIEASLRKDVDASDTKILIEDIFTVLHQIKGTAPMLNIHGIAQMVTPVERVFLTLREGKISFSQEIKSNTIHLVMAIIAELAVNQQDNLDSEDKRNTLCFFESMVL